MTPAHSPSTAAPRSRLGWSYRALLAVVTLGLMGLDVWRPGTVRPLVRGPKIYGVNIAGAEFGLIDHFGQGKLPGTLGVDYLYAAPPAYDSYGYFARQGLTLLRIPFHWERVQRAPQQELSGVDVLGLRRMLDAAAAHQQRVILDLHNFGRYYGRPLGTSDAALLADVWQRLALEFRGHPALWGYELMNEPHALPDGAAGWAILAQAATDAIRAVDQTHYILVPGYDFQSAARWRRENEYLDIRDPVGKLIYTAHLYFDRDGSGRYVEHYAAADGEADLGVRLAQPFLDWLAAKNQRGIFTEYGVPDSDPRWLTVLDRFLTALDANPRILGGTYWAAGPWWGEYPLHVEPTGGVDRPQLQVLRQHPTR
jgi:endoglucanase